MAEDSEDLLRDYTLDLPPTELSEDSKHELRLWSGSNSEARLAREHLLAFQNKQDLSERAKIHYEATAEAYRRFGKVKQLVPFVLPAMWL